MLNKMQKEVTRNRFKRALMPYIKAKARLHKYEVLGIALEELQAEENKAYWDYQDFLNYVYWMYRAENPSAKSLEEAELFKWLGMDYNRDYLSELVWLEEDIEAEHSSGEVEDIPF